MLTASNGIFLALVIHQCNLTFIPTAKFPPFISGSPRSVAASKFSKQELGALAARTPYVLSSTELPREVHLPQPPPPPSTQLHKEAPDRHCSPLLLLRPGLPPTQCCWGPRLLSSWGHRTPLPQAFSQGLPMSGLDFHCTQSCLPGLVTTSIIVFVAVSVLRQMLGKITTIA